MKDGKILGDPEGKPLKFKIVFTEKLFTSKTPKTIKNNPNTACQDKDCLKKIYPNIATVKTPRPLHVA